MVNNTRWQKTTKVLASPPYKPIPLSIYSIHLSGGERERGKNRVNRLRKRFLRQMKSPGSFENKRGESECCRKLQTSFKVSKEEVEEEGLSCSFTTKKIDFCFNQVTNRVQSLCYV